MKEKEKSAVKKRIKIKDLPPNLELSEEDLKRVQGGAAWYTTLARWFSNDSAEGGGGSCGVCGVRG
jgi:hypothetical protein